MNNPIHYKLKAKLIKVNLDRDLDFFELNESFEAQNPIDARIKAFKQYQNYIDVLLESKGTKYVSDGEARTHLKSFITPNKSTKLKIGGAEIEFIDSFGNGIGLYLIIDTPLEDSVDKKGDEIFIHGIDDSYFGYNNPDRFLLGLEREYEYYEHFQLNTNGKEKEIVFCNRDEWEEGFREDEPSTYKILETPFSWEGLEQPYWWGKTESEEHIQNVDQISIIKEIIRKGETNKVEFKPSLLYNFSTDKPGISIKAIIAKTICALLNSNGGLLLIGVGNNGSIQGLDFDFKLSGQKDPRDFFLLEYDQMLEHFLSFSIKDNVNGRFFEIEGKTIFVVIVDPSKRRPIFLKGQNGKEFYIRGEASSRLLIDMEEITNYCIDRFSNQGQK
jgi:hypothetical protein